MEKNRLEAFSGGLCPIAVFIVISVVSLWWVFTHGENHNAAEAVGDMGAAE